MQRFLEIAIVTLIVLIAGWLQVGWVRVWPIGGSAINLLVLIVIAVALFRPWPSAMWAAGVGGFYLAQYSVWPWYVYLIGFLAMVGSLRLLTLRLMAAKSTASLIIAISAATVLFYAFIAGQVELIRIFQHGVLGNTWSALIAMAALQCIVHPIILYLAWRRLTGGSFSTTVGSNLRQPF